MRIEPLRRHYNDREAARVVDLFGDRPRWGATMQPLQLAFLAQVLPGFTGACSFDLALPVSYDVEVAAHKFLAGLEEGAVPLLLLFSGQVFTGTAGSIAVEPVPWHKEATARLPVAVWREAMDAHFPDQAWLRVSRRHPRPALGVPRPPRPARLGRRHPRRLLDGRADGPSATTYVARLRPRAWPTRSSTRATCSTPTGPRHRRTRCAGSGAC